MAATRRDMIVIGGSAGAMTPLLELVAGLPESLPAVVCVVMHLPAWRPSDLPAILSRAARMPATTPAHLQQLERGHIYVAPPDHHLIVEDGRAYVWRGPKENQHRPAVNALFRSAAVTYGRRVIGVVLSGAMEDGATGLWWVKRYGGLAIVQDPHEARFPGMPTMALATVQPDYVVAAAAMAELLIRLVTPLSLIPEPLTERG